MFFKENRSCWASFAGDVFIESHEKGSSWGLEQINKGGLNEDRQAVVGAVASDQEGSGFDSGSGLFLCRVCLSRPCLILFSFPHTSQKQAHPFDSGCEGKVCVCVFVFDLRSLITDAPRSGAENC